jgi:S-adenosylmethionine decarboxylase
MNVGIEWLVDAEGCRPEDLRLVAALEAVFRRLVAELGLHALGAPLWRRFPGPGGVTGLLLLSESHLACHTYPEHGLATFNLYCCRARPAWPWAERLAEMLGATRVHVRVLARGSASERRADRAALTSPRTRAAASAPRPRSRRATR